MYSVKLVEKESIVEWLPTLVLESGPDIIFFWVARMVGDGKCNLLIDVPFQKV